LSIVGTIMCLGTFFVGLIFTAIGASEAQSGVTGVIIVIVGIVATFLSLRVLSSIDYCIRKAWYRARHGSPRAAESVEKEELDDAGLFKHLATRLIIISPAMGFAAWAYKRFGATAGGLMIGFGVLVLVLVNRGRRI
jgi:hypothetical protein